MSVMVRIGANVTTVAPMNPVHKESSFVFDYRTLQLYLDLQNGTRVPVRDPLVLRELEDGVITRFIEVINTSGTTRSRISVNNSGDFTFDHPVIMEMVNDHYGDPSATDNYRIAVFDENGKLQYVSLEDLKSDIAASWTSLNVETTSVVKDLTFHVVDTAGGDVPPETLNFTYIKEDVVSSVSLRALANADNLEY